MSDKIITVTVEATDNPRVNIVDGRTCASPAEARKAVVDAAKAAALEMFPKEAK